MPNAISVLAVCRARRDVRPVGGVLHEQDRRRTRRRRRHRHHRPDRREHPPGRQGQERVGVRHDGVHPGPAPARAADRRRPRGGRPDPADLRRRRRGRDLGVPAQLRHRPARRNRRHAGGHHRRRRDPLHGRRHPGPAGAQGRRRAPEGDRPRLRPRPGAVHRGPGLRRERLLLRHRRHRRRPAQGRPLLRRRLHHAVDRHALASRARCG